MTSADVGNLVFYEGSVNGQSYIQLVGDSLIGFIDSFVFTQDDAPPHESKHAMNFFEQNQISITRWLATSPDLNPIENMWNIIDNQLKSMRPNSLVQLQTMVQHIWTDTDPANCKGLVASMPRRLKSCQLVKGGTMSKY